MTVRFYSSTAIELELASGISNVQTSCQSTVTPTGWPTSFPCQAVLDSENSSEELVLVTNIVGTSFTIVRQQDGSAAVPHSQGAVLRHVAWGLDFREANTHVNAIADAHGVGPGNDVVGTGTVQTISQKTLDSTNILNSVDINTPDIDGGTIDGAAIGTSTLTAPTIAGATLSGTIAGGTFTGTTLTAPTVGDFTNAQHDHSDLNDGGQLLPPTVQVFSTSGTWNKPAGLRAARVRVVGGGGGGGGVAATAVAQGAQGGGGGGGGFSEKLIPASALGATETVTGGAGGAGGVAGNNAGSTGGTPSFGAHCSATGGSGGSGGAATPGSLANEPGVGGIGLGGDINAAGDEGGPGLVSDDSGVARVRGNSYGGGSALGGSVNVSLAASTVGENGRAYGGGGSGAFNGSSNAAKAGGAGADGVVIVENFF